MDAQAHGEDSLPPPSIWAGLIQPPTLLYRKVGVVNSCGSLYWAIVARALSSTVSYLICDSGE